VELGIQRLLPEGSMQWLEKVTSMFLSGNQQNGGVKLGASKKKTFAKGGWGTKRKKATNRNDIVLLYRIRFALLVPIQW
jgi:hypothetical protein